VTKETSSVIITASVIFGAIFWVFKHSLGFKHSEVIWSRFWSRVDATINHIVPITVTMGTIKIFMFWTSSAIQATIGIQRIVIDIMTATMVACIAELVQTMKILIVPMVIVIGTIWLIVASTLDQNLDQMTSLCLNPKECLKTQKIAPNITDAVIITLLVSFVTQ
jgi:hypothetical protein